MTDIAALQLRQYAEGDEQQILALYQRSFGRALSEAFWRWRFESNPIGERFIALMCDGDRTVGHYAVTPVRLFIEGRTVLTGLSGTTMTDPQYRGLGIFPALASHVYEDAARRGLAMVWGFPNSLSHGTFTQALGWRDIYEIPTLTLDLSSAKSAPAVSLQIEAPDSFDDRFDRLWQRISCRSHAAVLVVRDAEYLRWRYTRNPINQYDTMTLGSSREIHGYVVFKKYQDGLDIVDLLVEDDAAAGVALIAGVVSRASSLALSEVRLWLNASDPLRAGVERLGFRLAAPVTYFSARILDDRRVGAAPYDFRRWHFSLGDSDVY